MCLIVSVVVLSLHKSETRASKVTMMFLHMDVALKVFFFRYGDTRLNLKTIFVCVRHIIVVKVTVPTKAVLYCHYTKQQIKET